MNSKIKQEEEKLRGLENSKLQLITKLDAYNQTNENIRQKSEDLKTQVSNKQGFITEYKDKLSAAKSQLSELPDPKEEGGSLEALTSELARLSERYNQANIQFIQQDNLCKSLNQEESFTKNRTEELHQRIEESKSSSRLDADLVAQLKIELEEINAFLQEKYKEKAAKSSLLSEIEQKYFSMRSNIHENEDAIREKNRTLNQLQVSINTMKEKYAEVKFKIDAVSERLRIEFQIELKDIQQTEIEEDVDIDQLNLRVEKLRNRLNNFGEINPMAVEAFDEMKIRFDDITKQKNDIEEAKESLLETIKEIEETATGQFMEAFEKVRVNFIDVFRSLFSEEDNCDLILLNAENPLESNIEIIAKPKGKRPKSLSQLSGGEKTLTATALLFALYLLKPAPFCIFDEVDAPLDDANIQKFNRIIKKFSEQSQFIIVTHNKATMAEVDILYGVYMQEQGVSGVTAVDFRYQEHNPILEALN